MSNKQIHTFFSYPFNHYTDVDHAVRLVKVIPETAHIVMMRDSNQPLHKDLKKVLNRRLGVMVPIRPSGPWNRLWKEIASIEQAALAREEPFDQATGVWFLSEFPPEVIHQAMKRHRTVPCLTGREAYWLNTIHLGPEFDEVVGQALDSPYFGPTDRQYRDLTAVEAFDLSGFEGLRFMSPVQDDHATKAMKAMMSLRPVKEQVTA